MFIHLNRLSGLNKKNMNRKKKDLIYKDDNKLNSSELFNIINHYNLFTYLIFIKPFKAMT